MSPYQWTAQQRARLVPGATVVCEGQRATVARIAYSLTRNDAFSFKADGGVVAWSGAANPSTIRPPTLAWLRKMARKKLGKGADVGLRGVGGAVVATCDHVVVTLKLGDGGVRWAGEFRDLPALDARSSCALWLHALPESEVSRG